MTKEQLRAWRKLNMMTQNELALFLGLSTRTIQNYELGSHNVPKAIEIIARLTTNKARSLI